MTSIAKLNDIYTYIEKSILVLKFLVDTNKILPQTLSPRVKEGGGVGGLKLKQLKSSCAINVL